MVRVTGVVFLLVLFAGIIFADDLMELKDQNTNTRFKIDPSGNVNIGTPAQGASLDVSGTIQATNAGGTIQIYNSAAGTGTLNGITDVDIRTGGVPRIVVKNSGNVGIGKSPSSTVKFDIQGQNGDVIAFDRGDSSVRFSAGYSSATTDMYLGTSTAHRLRFKTGDADRMAIDASGNVTIGGVNPDVKLSVAGGLKLTGGAESTSSYGTSNVGLVGSGYGSPVVGKLLFGTDNSGWQFRIAKRVGTAESDIMYFADNNFVGIGTSPSFQLQLSTDSAGKPSGGSWQVSSDERLKKDIRAFEDGLETVKGIRPVYFKFNGLAGLPADGKEKIGVIAQEVIKVAPYTVGTYKAKLNETDVETTEIYSFDASALPFVLINAVKELDGKNRDLKKENDALQKKCDDFESRCKAMEEKLSEESKSKEEFEARLKALEEKLAK